MSYNPVKFAKPALRTTWYTLLRWRAATSVHFPHENEHNQSLQLAFIVGCGRSGTTILGNLLAEHPEVKFLNEPYHLWVIVSRRTDVTNLHYKTAANFFLDKDHGTKESIVRFNRLFGHYYPGPFRMIEKTPHNVARIGFLEALTFEPRFIHIIRNGLDVVRSIDRVATHNAYKMAGKSNINQWWGRDNCKWKTLALEGSQRGYFSNEVGLLNTDLQRGAYEWLVSLGEADRWRPQLKNRFLEITYTQFSAEPAIILRQLCRFLELSCPSDWLEKSVQKIHPTNHARRSSLRLPPEMSRQFNAYQQCFGFDGEASPIIT